MKKPYNKIIFYNNRKILYKNIYIYISIIYIGKYQGLINWLKSEFRIPSNPSFLDKNGGLACDYGLCWKLEKYFNHVPSLSKIFFFFLWDLCIVHVYTLYREKVSPFKLIFNFFLLNRSYGLDICINLCYARTYMISQKHT